MIRLKLPGCLTILRIHLGNSHETINKRGLPPGLKTFRWRRFVSSRCAIGCSHRPNMIEVSEFVWMVELFVGWCYMRKGKYIVWLMCGFFICHKISVIRFPWWKGSGFKHVQAYVAKFNDSGHEGQQVQQPDAGGCLVTPVNKFLSSWDCRSCFSTVATNHLQSGIILQALNFSSTWTRANTYRTTDHVFWWSPLYYLYTCTRVLTHSRRFLICVLYLLPML